MKDFMIQHLDFSSKMHKFVPDINWEIKGLLTMMLY